MANPDLVSHRAVEVTAALTADIGYRISDIRNSRRTADEQPIDSRPSSCC